MTLSELLNMHRELMEMAKDPEVDLEAVMDTLEGLEGEIEDKADAYAAVMGTLNGDAAMIGQEMARLRDRKAALENRADRLKDRLYRMMLELDKKKFKTAVHSYNIQKNPPKVVIDHPEVVPKKYLIEQDPKINTKQIGEDLKAGELFAWAHLEQGESLRIR